MSIPGIPFHTLLAVDIQPKDLIGIGLVVGIAAFFAIVVIYGARFKPKTKKRRGAGNDQAGDATNKA